MASGDISSEALVRACLERIDEREAAVRAWATIDRENALTRARAADRIRRESKLGVSPLLGIPIGVKDVIDTADLPTEYNSPIFRGHRPSRDAAVVALLRRAGAIVLGKTETVEFAAHGRPAPTRNPRNLSRTPSGSSSGSAAAVADFMVPLALGTQTGGSLIRPSSYCGCVGFKPTYGVVSMEGVKPFSVSLDTIGWCARSVADVSLVARVLIEEVVPGTTRDVAGLKIGVCRTPYWERAEPATRNGVEEAVQRINSAGATVADVEFDDDFAALQDLHEITMCGEGYLSFLSLMRWHRDDISESIRNRLRHVSIGELLSAADKAASLRPKLDRLLGRFDAILTPSAPGEAPLSGSIAADATFNNIWTLLHTPCITVPGLVGPAGLPIGIQLIAGRGHDAQLLEVASAIAPLLGCSSNAEHRIH